ncbi:hypothetical protein E8E13_010461 [Curvularia kusanoi]|uniref:Uncharacterized protein n=1 Tax=Curvularia kusanoi TaxID=90978 RepID=A0A9P4TJL3_CURKU|nr:hypothetical protein E8E13_010461 [Curvularia kusanoi]
MAHKLSSISILYLVLVCLTISSFAFIASPLDWIFDPSNTRGLVCPSLRYGCCSDLETWRQGSPCAFPLATTRPEECFERREWACCQVEDDSFTCTTGFQKGPNDRGFDAVYGWRSGTSTNYFGIGKGALTQEEKQALGRSR